MTRTKVVAEGCWQHDHCQRHYDGAYFDAFHNLGQVVYLCEECETRYDNDARYRDHVDRLWCAAMRKAAASGLLLGYFCKGEASLHQRHHIAHRRGDDARQAGLSWEDRITCLGFLKEASDTGHAPAETFVVVPVGPPRGHLHVNLRFQSVRLCLEAQEVCTRRMPAWSMRHGAVMAAPAVSI